MPNTFISNAQRKNIIHGLFNGYYKTIDKPVIFDTNRSWCIKMDLLADLFTESRVIACVRHIPWIIDSIERYAVKNPYQPSLIYDYKSGGTVYMHVKDVFQHDFDNVHQETVSYDEKMGTPGLHSVLMVCMAMCKLRWEVFARIKPDQPPFCAKHGCKPT